MDYYFIKDSTGWIGTMTFLTLDEAVERARELFHNTLWRDVDHFFIYKIDEEVIEQVEIINREYEKD